MPVVTPSWETDVWNIVEAVYKRLADKKPIGFSSGEAFKVHTKTVSAELSKTGESRGKTFNLAWLNPCQMSIPNDVMCAAKAAKSGRYHFWDQQNNRPLARLHGPAI